MRKFKQVLDFADLAAEGRSTPVFVDGHPILLWRTEDGIYATEASCPHRGFPLTQATLTGHSLRCALHGSTFDIRNGQGACYDLRVYQTRIIDGRIWLGPELGSLKTRLLNAIAPPDLNYRPYVRPSFRLPSPYSR